MDRAEITTTAQDMPTRQDDPDPYLPDNHIQTDQALETLLRQILAQVSDKPQFDNDKDALIDAAGHGGARELLEIQVDGLRYVLLCALPQEPTVRATLSPREREIIRLVAKGLPNKTVAAVLDISQWTVATYLKRIFAKLGVASRTEMVASAMRIGLTGSK
jgi:DNA-binding CsgD family transcriptional regulator